MQNDHGPELIRSPATATLIGLSAGMFSALLGVGGGLLMVPAMVYLLRIRQHRAHGTSLAVICPASAAGVWQYASHGNVEWRIALLLAIGGVLGAIVGARLSAALNAPQLKRAFGVFVVITGILLIVFPPSTDANRPALLVSEGLGWMVIVAVGTLAGAVSGLLGVGGGAIMIPAVVFLLGLSQKMAQGISLAVIIPVALSGSLIHYRKGNVIPYLAAWMSIGAMVGAIVIGNLVGKLEDETLRLIFGVFLIAVGVSMATRRGRSPSDGTAG